MRSFLACRRDERGLDILQSSSQSTFDTIKVYTRTKYTLVCKRKILAPDYEPRLCKPCIFCWAVSAILFAQFVGALKASLGVVVVVTTVDGSGATFAAVVVVSVGCDPLLCNCASTCFFASSSATCITPCRA